MSNEIHESETPSGAYRRALFTPVFGADDTDENVTFDDIPLNSTLAAFGVEDPPSLDSYDANAPANRPVFSGIVALGVVAGGGALAALTMFALLMAGMYAMNVEVDNGPGPQINGVNDGPVDVIRD